MKVLVAVLAVSLLALAGCGTEGAPDPAPPPQPPSPGASLSAAAQLAAQYGLGTKGRSSAFTDLVPDHPMASARWGLIEIACAGSGFDLGPYCGEQATFTSYAMARQLHGSPATFWTIERDGCIVGAYVTVEEATPGILSLRQAEAQL